MHAVHSRLATGCVAVLAAKKITVAVMISAFAWILVKLLSGCSFRMLMGAVVIFRFFPCNDF